MSHSSARGDFLLAFKSLPQCGQSRREGAEPVAFLTMRARFADGQREQQSDNPADDGTNQCRAQNGLPDNGLSVTSFVFVSNTIRATLCAAVI